MITAQQYEEATGTKPKDDDLERANCKLAGQEGHMSCGWCQRYNLPYTMVNRATSSGATKQYRR